MLMKPLAALLISLAMIATCCTRRGPAISDGPIRSEVADCSDSKEGRKRIDINTAGAKELESLDGIGEVLAARIVEHRNRYGRFRRVSDIIIVDGISEKKYRTIEIRICAGD